MAFMGLGFLRNSSEGLGVRGWGLGSVFKLSRQIQIPLNPP